LPWLNCYARVLKRNSRRRSFGVVIDRRKAEVAGYAVAAFVVVLLGLRLLHHDGGGAAGAPVSLAGAQDERHAHASSQASPRLLVVDVAGEVRRPGVYRVPSGSRVDAAVQQAGGFTRHGESSAVNLAMPLHDGQQVVVPRHGSVPTPGTAPVGGAAGGSGGPGAAPAQPISLSTATVEQLDTLDGIGPTLATRIVAYREAHGGFRSIDELRQVDGIGDKRFESLRKAVTP
jgi:competence protein ComEA